MKAMLMTAVNQPLSPRDIPDPQPGPGQVRIRLHATGVCGTDIHIWHGELPVPLPIVPGHEPVGTIDAVGPGAASLKPGDRVGVSWFQGGCGRCSSCQKKRFKFCAEPKTWITNGGGYADYMIAEANGRALLPEKLAWDSAAPLFCGGFRTIGHRKFWQSTGCFGPVGNIDGGNIQRHSNILSEKSPVATSLWSCRPMLAFVCPSLSDTTRPSTVTKELYKEMLKLAMFTRNSRGFIHKRTCTGRHMIPISVHSELIQSLSIVVTI
jgi:hypothetical protein